MVHTLTSVAESGDLPSPRDGTDCGPSGSAKSTPGAAGCSPRTSPASPSTTTLPLWPEEPSGSGSLVLWTTPTCRDAAGPNFTHKPIQGQGLAAQVSTSSPPATPASRSHSPGSAWARKMTAISGRTLLRSLPISGPLGASLRTLLGTSLWGSTACWLTWNKSVTPAGRSLYRLVPSAPRIGATGFGSSPDLWPTPNVCGGGNTAPLTPHKGHFLRRSGEKAHLGLDQAVRLWPTPRTEGFDAGSHRGSPDSLHAAVKLWPTPRASENENRQTKPTPSQLAGQHGLSLAAEVGGKLNPDWVARLMGYPDNWLDLGTADGKTACPASPPDAPTG